MRLTSWEEERLLIFTAAELARRHRDRGLLLNAPEVIALICDAMLEAARAGASFDAVEAAGRAAVRPDEAMAGVAALVDEVRLEVLLEDGTRLIVLLDPLGGAGREPGGPGSVTLAAEPLPDPTAALPRCELQVRSTSTRVIRVSSHFPFDRVNARQVFDREAARGFRLDLPAGSSARWAPGETRTVRLVRYAADQKPDRGGEGKTPREPAR
jgi:urease subunit gamma/beta